ncbi:NUDIX domain-containing protein [Microbispora sp. H10885]|uniref:NUDIX domain-containing protein n=1 Tax=Microbispora sp. H10885 TaxID=2729110 RepID=UPI00160017BA|nr:NUDIX hydrolase [Microbispora sp. H10885]
MYNNGWIKVTEDRVVRPGGQEGIFGIVTMKEGSTVLPITADGDVYLVKEYKYGIGRFSIEVMSGGMEEHEDPLGAAKRELKEELGLEAQRWTYLGYVDPFTTVVRSKNHMFLAEELETGAALEDPSEVVEAMRLPLKEAVAMVIQGEITHSASCVLLLRANNYLRS